MNGKQTVKWILLAFVGLCAVVLAARPFRDRAPDRRAASAAAAPGNGTSSASAPAAGDELSSKDRVVAIYFVGRVRCSTCRTIESLAKQAIEGGFAAELASGRLALRQVNLDLPENGHFTDDFGMTNRTLVLAEYRGGKVLRHRKLDEVWTLADDGKAFDRYVRSELGAFLASR